MVSDPTRRDLLRGIGLTGTVGVAGCLSSGGGGGGAGDGSGGDGSSGGTATPTADGDGGPPTVGVVYSTGGLGDKSFNDMANRGAKRARMDYNVEFRNAEPSDTSSFEAAQREFAASTSPTFDLICCIGFSQTEALQTVAEEFPDRRFMLVDGVVDTPNVANYVFKEHQGSFQVGHLAGLLTRRRLSAGGGATAPDSRTVGFVGGVEVPLIKKFEAGYVAGVDHASAGIDVLREYVGAFDDPEGGRVAAAEMYDQGADVVYHAAGGTGIGVFQAAQAADRYAIGVDSDQSRSDPQYADVILASMVKRVDTAVYQAIGTVVNGSFEGATRSLGLARNGVEAVFGTGLLEAIPEAVQRSLQESGSAIRDGSIEVPTEPSSDA
jgi:basic membrane protein A